MTVVTLEAVLTQARKLPPADQARLTLILERERALRLATLLDEWAEDETGYDEEAWPALREALEEARILGGMGSLFHDSSRST
jgi:hypothetical protein